MDRLLSVIHFYKQMMRHILYWLAYPSYAALAAIEYVDTKQNSLLAYRQPHVVKVNLR